MEIIQVEYNPSPREDRTKCHMDTLPGTVYCRIWIKIYTNFICLIIEGIIVEEPSRLITPL